MKFWCVSLKANKTAGFVINNLCQFEQNSYIFGSFPFTKERTYIFIAKKKLTLLSVSLFVCVSLFIYFLATPAYNLHVSNNSCFDILFVYFHLPWYFPLHIIMLSVCNGKDIYIHLLV